MSGIQAALGKPSQELFESLANDENQAKEAADTFKARNG